MRELCFLGSPTTRELCFAWPGPIAPLLALLVFGLAPAMASAGAPTASATPGAPPAAAPSASAAVLLLPTLMPAGDAPGAALHRPAESDTSVWLRAQELDATLRDGAQDLGLIVPLGEVPVPDAPRDADLIARASAPEPKWVISPRIEPHEDGFVVRIVAVPPGSKEMRVRVETVKAADVAARGLVMLRDILRAPPAPSAPAIVVSQPATAQASRSSGRAVLAISGTLFGAFVAYGVNRVAQTGGDFGDPRVVLPLSALGGGAGLAASLLVAEEWDVSSAMAWQVAGGTWWGVGSGLFLASGANVVPLNDRFFWAIAGGGIGLTAATIGLVRRRVDDGGMLLTQSSAALGTGVGGLVELLANGPRDPIARPTPSGWGFGSAIGFGTGAFFATFVKIAPSRVLLVDLGLALGALAGASIASPLIATQLDPDKTRGWVIATLGGTVAGGAIAMVLTRGIKPSQAAWRWGTPYAGVIATTPIKDGAAPAIGGGWQGAF